MKTHFALKRSVRGEVIVRGEPRYKAARGDLLYNRRAPHVNPAIIVRALDASDVQATVRYAAREGLSVSPRGSGHNWSGIAMQDGIVLDLSALKDLVIDPVARTAEAGPALDNRTVVRRLAEHGLAFPVGHCGHVSLSGYLLGGGLGWNSERWGLGCHNVTAIDVVTADGVLRRASESENPDLFWAARGGGPAFFGVVTQYHLALHPLPRAITTANRFYPIARIGEIQGWMQAAKGELPDNLEFTAVLMAAPPEMAPADERVVLATATIFADSEAEARKALDRLAQMAPPDALAEIETPSSFEDLFAPFDTTLPQGKRYAVESLWSAAPSADFMAKFAEQLARAPSPECLAVSAVMPPPQGDAPAGPDTAFSMDGPGFGLIYAVWDKPEDDETHIAWLRGASDALAGETVGRYVGEADLGRPGWLAQCYAPDAWARLSGLRRRFDPQAVFRRADAAKPDLPMAV